MTQIIYFLRNQLLYIQFISQSEIGGPLRVRPGSLRSDPLNYALSEKKIFILLVWITEFELRVVVQGQAMNSMSLGQAKDTLEDVPIKCLVEKSNLCWKEITDPAIDTSYNFRFYF